MIDMIKELFLAHPYLVSFVILCTVYNIRMAIAPDRDGNDTEEDYVANRNE